MEISIVYPHQLFSKHPALKKERAVWMIEDPLFFGNDPHWPADMHKQKLVLHRASMKAYANKLKTSGFNVNYIDAPTGSHTDSCSLLKNELPESVQHIHLTDPVDTILLKRIKRFAESKKIHLYIYPSPNFLSPSEFLETHIASKKKPFMARFYEMQRKRMNILLDEDQSPIGGKWSFDTENRVKLPKNHIPPIEPLTIRNTYIEEATNYISDKFAANIGSIKHFRWPVTHNDSEIWLDRFIEERFENFGIYEDAISSEYAFLYHAALTPMLNIGLLDPNDIVNRVLEKAEQTNNIPLNSLEGFIRQIIGWREFMRGIYIYRGTEIRNGNFWGFTRPIPKCFYDGTTGIPIIDHTIKQLLHEGYCHHIERLMVLGNFMLLCRIKPDDVYRWFMEMFIDSYDWVMVPNVYGMSQFADGGTFTTKPYLSGSNYILKMSDAKKGLWCEVWDGLFWTFISDHKDFFLKNPRLSMMVRTWEKQSPEKQNGHKKAAENFLNSL